MKAVVTGVAGFIGSSLADRLLNDDWDVIGIDSFVPYYPRVLKERNLAGALANPRFMFLEGDLADIVSGRHTSVSPHQLFEGTDVVFHQAAQAGVRASWGRDFDIYCHNNILATQILLEACRSYPGLKIVYASSSSVYGETRKFPMEETDLPAPVSPYGVSKLAAEHLMNLYHANFGLHTVSLRYFTVYGPRQRPDMAFHKLCRAVLTGEEFVLFGTGEQTRDFTYIDDIVEANLAAARQGRPGGVYNLGGGTRISMNDVITLVEELAGRKANVQRIGRHEGDVTHTGADVGRARRDLGFAPKVDLRSGLARELEFIKQVILSGPMQ